MGNIPSKPVVVNQEWTNGVTKLNQTNLTSGVNQNITNIKTAVDGIIDALGGPGADPGNFEEITWADLKALRDGGNLVPDKLYRITDYVTTTSEENTHSAGHQFDVIVKALSADKLSEEAHAILHEGDTYFANSNLNAWKLWYSIDNDTNRFDWADVTNGKGVIYRMIDEFGNDLPYDFKNIIYSFVKEFSYSKWGSNCIFKRDSSLDADGYYGWRSSKKPPAWSNPYCFTSVETPTTSMTLYSDTSGTNILSGGSIKSVSLKEFETYTFNYVSSGSNYDASMEGLTKSCYNNVIKEYYLSNKLQLNWNIFYTTTTTSTTFSCYSNTFGDNCYSNTFSNGCYSNTFGNDCHNNTFGAYCHNNTFGNEWYSNTVGDNCNHNTFGDICSSNTFGNECHSNTSGDNFSYNIFGNSCSSNIFGNSCSSNTFGAYCYSNTFGSYCWGIILIDYCENIVIDNGCSDIYLSSDGTPGSLINFLQNVHIHLGVKGASSSNRLVISVPRNLPYETEYYLDNLGNLTVSNFSTRITWADLKALRDAGKLVPGKQYRITDYLTAVEQPECRSADHPFDIIITALTANTLSEDAKAVVRDGDNYFAKPNVEIAAWKLKYCLDNDYDRFGFAVRHEVIRVDVSDPTLPTYLYLRYPSLDGNSGLAWVRVSTGDSREIEDPVVDYDDLDTSDIIYTANLSVNVGDELNMDGTPVTVVSTRIGKGVIYEMEDEWGNKLPYDFKNVQFKRYRVTHSTSAYNGFDGQYVGNKHISGSIAFPQGYTIEDDFKWCYTFNWYNEDGESEDYSIVGNTSLYNDEGFISGCYNNVFGTCMENAFHPTVETLQNRMYLGNNVMWDAYEIKSGVSFGFSLNNVGGGSFNNTAGSGFNGNVVGVGFYFNIVGDDFGSNTVGNRFYGNIVGHNCAVNTVENDFQMNTIGDRFQDNIIGNYFFRNTVGNDFQKNTVGNEFQENTVEQGFTWNAVGNRFASNTVKVGFIYNTVGNAFSSNTVGESFSHNTVGNDFRNNTMGNHISKSSMKEGISYITLGNPSGSFMLQLKYITIGPSVQGDSSSNPLVITPLYNKNYEQEYVSASKVVRQV